MIYLYDACDQISDFCHQQLLRKMRRKISWTDGRTEVKQYIPLGGIIRLTQQVPHVEKELLTLLKLLSSPPFFLICLACVALSLVFCVMFCRSLFVLFLLAIVLSVLIRFTASDYPFGIFKPFNNNLFSIYDNQVTKMLTYKC